MMVLVVVSVSIIEFNLIQLLPQNHESCDPNNGGGVYNHILQWPKCVCVCVCVHVVCIHVLLCESANTIRWLLWLVGVCVCCRISTNRSDTSGARNYLSSSRNGIECERKVITIWFTIIKNDEIVCHAMG